MWRYFIQQVGLGEPVGRSYERICFAKDLINGCGKPIATFVYPGHPLLNIAIAICTRTNQNPRSAATRILVLCPNKHGSSYSVISLPMKLWLSRRFGDMPMSLVRALEPTALCAQTQTKKNFERLASQAFQNFSLFV